MIVFSAVQEDYLNARVQYQRAYSIVQVETDNLHKQLEDNELTLDQWLDQVQAIEDKYNLDSINEKLRNREEILIDWVLEKTKETYNKVVGGQPDFLMSAVHAMRNLPHTRSRLIELALQI